MGAQPDPQSERSEAVTWLGRDRAPFEPVPSGEDKPGFSLRRSFRDSPSTWFVGVVALLLALLAVIWASRSGSPSGTHQFTAEDSLPLVSVLSPGLSPVTSRVNFTGTISARYDMPIGVDTDTGRITAIYVEAGDHVKRGQVMARLDPSILAPQVNRLAASLEEARAEAELSQAQYRRGKGVEAAGALSAEDIEKRRATAVTDEARVKVAAAQLAEFQARVDRTVVRAPADGIVLTRAAEVGQIASPGGTALFRLARGGEVEMRGQIAEQDLAALKVGQPAQVYLTGIAKPFDGRVRLLGAVIDPQTRLGEIRIELPVDPNVRPGAFARGEVIVGRGNLPVVPQTAVLSDGGGSYVLIVNSQGLVEHRAVHVTDTLARGVVISEGLSGQERVVATAGGFLRVGERVTVAPGNGRG